MITVKKLATMVVLGSLAFWGNVGAYYKDKAGNICPVKGDKMQVTNLFPGECSWDLQVSEEGRLNFESGYGNGREVFTVKEIVTLYLPDGKPAECFKLETCNKKDLKLIKGSKGYVIEESSEKNKSNAQDVCFKFYASGENQNIRCFPNGKIEKTTKIIDGKETEKIMLYGIYIRGCYYDNDRDAEVSSGWGDDFIITFLTPETSVPQEKITVQEVKKATPKNIKEKVVTQENTITPKAKEDGKALEELTRKLEEQLEINRKLQEEINNLKAGKSSDAAIIEEESKPVVSSKQSQPSRVSAPRQGARGRSQTPRK